MITPKFSEVMPLAIRRVAHKKTGNASLLQESVQPSNETFLALSRVQHQNLHKLFRMHIKRMFNSYTFFLSKTELKT